MGLSNLTFYSHFFFPLRWCASISHSLCFKYLILIPYHTHGWLYCSFLCQRTISPFFVHYSQSGYYFVFSLLRLGRSKRCTKIIFHLPESVSLLWVSPQSLFLAHSVTCHMYQFVLLTHLPVLIFWGNPGLLWCSWPWIMLHICKRKWTDLNWRLNYTFKTFFLFYFHFHSPLSSLRHLFIFFALGWLF